MCWRTDGSERARYSARAASRVVAGALPPQSYSASPAAPPVAAAPSEYRLLESSFDRGDDFAMSFVNGTWGPCGLTHPNDARAPTMTNIATSLSGSNMTGSCQRSVLAGMDLQDGGSKVVEPRVSQLQPERVTARAANIHTIYCQRTAPLRDPKRAAAENRRGVTEDHHGRGSSRSEVGHLSAGSTLDVYAYACLDEAAVNSAGLVFIHQDESETQLFHSGVLKAAGTPTFVAVTTPLAIPSSLAARSASSSEDESTPMMSVGGVGSRRCRRRS